MTRFADGRVHHLHDARRPAERHGHGVRRVARRQPLDRHQRRAGAPTATAGSATYTTRDGLPHDAVRALLEDRAGTLWIGMRGGGLARFVDGRFTTITRAEGVAGSVIRALHEARDGAMWVGSDVGLIRLDAAGPRTYTDARRAVARRRLRHSRGRRRRAVDWHLRRRHQPVQERPLHPLHHRERAVRRHRLSGARGSRGLAVDHVQQGPDARAASATSTRSPTGRPGASSVRPSTARPTACAPRSSTAARSRPAGSRATAGSGCRRSRACSSSTRRRLRSNALPPPVVIEQVRIDRQVVASGDPSVAAPGRASSSSATPR